MGIWRALLKSVTIFEYERGVRFHNGKLTEVAGPGKYRYFSTTTRIEVFDMRPQILQINGQEVLTADNVTVKISLAVGYRVIDPKVLLTQYNDYAEYVYTTCQLKLREVISSIEMDDVLSSRRTLNEAIKELVLQEGSLVGLEIISLDIKDMMMSAELKKVFTEVVRTRKEALASLEKARGETATLRSLAKAAKMIENNPELAKLRLLHTIESSQGNTFMIDGK
ncbi:slipin family protein [Fictibacillus aquaticus]|uniref:slipin family protein n=1 Tax=Fictibacillus aquaticus TaxID=2021314 RepID=UPI0013FD3C55|nr:slipin family protein [Fictibacillus aquaticus]